MIDLNKRQEELNTEIQSAQKDINTLRQILQQKEQGYVLLMGKIQEVKDLIEKDLEKPKVEETEEE